MAGFGFDAGAIAAEGKKGDMYLVDRSSCRLCDSCSYHDAGATWQKEDQDR